MARLRVITWNVHGSARPRIDAVAELLRAHEPDVVALQEVRSGQARRISALLGWRRPAWAFKHNGYWPLWWRGEGLAVLSHHRLARASGGVAHARDQPAELPAADPAAG